MPEESPAERIMRQRREELEGADALRSADPEFIAAALTSIGNEVASEVGAGMQNFYGIPQPPPTAGITAGGKSYNMVFGGHGDPQVMVVVTVTPRGADFSDPSKMHYSLTGYVRPKQRNSRDLIFDQNYYGSGRPGVSAAGVCRQIEAAFT